ncbi:MAG: hypothetical protein ACTSYA_11055 [Candidatus Kariarchaeaceae archaeon]
MESNSVGFRVFFLQAIRALNKSKVTYVLIGGVATTIYGHPRSTMGIDFIIQGNTSEISHLENA